MAATTHKTKEVSLDELWVGFSSVNGLNQRVNFSAARWRSLGFADSIEPFTNNRRLNY
jgi:hypothetical protein